MVKYKYVKTIHRYDVAQTIKNIIGQLEKPYYLVVNVSFCKRSTRPVNPLILYCKATVHRVFLLYLLTTKNQTPNTTSESREIIEIVFDGTT